MAHEWLRQYSQTGFASRSPLSTYDGYKGPSPNTQADHQSTDAHAENQAWDQRSIDGSERSWPGSVDPSEDGSVLEVKAEAAIDDTPSAPIAVPNRPREGAFAQPSLRALGSNGYDRPPISTYIEQRKISIGFDPKVQIEDDNETSSEGPLPRQSLRTRVRGKSLLDVMERKEPKSRARSEADSQEYDPETGERLDERPAPARDSRYNTSQPRWPLLQTTVDELASRDQLGKPESSSSLNSKTPLSPQYEYPTSPSADTIASPMAIPSPSREWYAAASLDLPRRLSSRSRSYIEGRTSFPKRASRRSTANSSASPASAFLSRYLPSSPLPQPDDEGQEIGDYVLGREIGFGGFSVIREAFTLSNSTRIARAVKVVRRNIRGKEESENEALQAEFEHEVEIWRSLRHPHILPLLAVYNTDFATFAITQLNTGGTLFDAVRNNRSGLEPRLARRYIAQLCLALRYLHEDMRIVHRDVKLENCLVNKMAPDAAETGGKLLLCDFGLADYYTSDNGAGAASTQYAQVYHHAQKAATYPSAARQALETGVDSGTPSFLSHTLGPSGFSTNLAGSLPYAAPEMLEYEMGILNPVVDMWALGVVCFAVIMGKLPFSHSFGPTLRTMITCGKWDKTGLKAKEDTTLGGGAANPSGDHFDRCTAGERSSPNGVRHALAGISEVVQGCMTINPSTRWDIQDVLCSTWLRDEVEKLDIED